MLRNVQPADLVYSLLNQLKDPATSLSEKYQILFSLRNIQGPEAQAALYAGESCLQGLQLKMSRLSTVSLFPVPSTMGKGLELECGSIL